MNFAGTTHVAALNLQLRSYGVMSAEKAPAVDIGLIRQAMAYRAKCRVKLPGNDRRKRIPLALLGVHRMNRGGQYPQSETVRNLNSQEY